MNDMNARKSRFTMYPVLTGLIALVSVLSSAPTAAAEFESGGYVGLGYGLYKEDSTGGFSVIKTGGAFKAYFGYQIKDYIGFEVGKTDFGDLKYDIGSGNVDRVEFDTYFARVNGYLPVWRDGKQMTALSLGLGALRWDTREEVKNSVGAVTSLARGHGAGAVGAAGLLVRGQNSAFRVEYEFYTGMETFNVGDTDIGQWSVNLMFYF